MISKVRILLYLLTALVAPLVFAQTGPGGVGNATGTGGQPANALWLDASSLTGLSSGNKVSQWTDRSGNNRPASQATTANQPTYVTNVLNGQPVIRFDRGTSPQFLQITAAGIGALVSNSRSVFLVAKANAGANASNRQGLFIAPLPNSGISFENNPNTRIVYEQFGANGAYLQQKNNISGNTLGWYLINQMAFTSPTYTSIWNNLNGFANAGVAASEPMRTYPDLVYLGRADFDWYLQGDIAEVVAYSANVSNTQRIVVENYLSAKYGIGVANDFYTAHEAGYVRDVQGIGTVDGTDKHALASAGQGLGLTELNTSLNAANEFVFAGHNAAANGLTNTDSPQYYNRWQRSWYIQKTGAVDARLSFDFVQAGLTVPSNLGGNLASYRLFYRSAASGAFGIVTGVTPTLQGSGGIGFDLTSAQLNSGYYTLGMVATPTFTWSPSASTTNWTTAANWTEGIVPVSTGDVIVNACTVCPALAGNVTVKTLTLNTASSLNLAGYILTTSEGALTPGVNFSNASVYSNGGKIKSRYLALNGSVFNGDITIEAYDVENSISAGGNTYNGKTTLVLSATAGNLSSGSYWRLGVSGSETFNENVTIRLQGAEDNYNYNIFYLQQAPANTRHVFNKDLTVYVDNANNAGSFEDVECKGKLSVITARDNNLFALGGNSILHKTVALDLQNSAAGQNPTTINFTPASQKQIVFKDSIRINAGSATAGTQGSLVTFGNSYQENAAGKCVFDSTASFSITSFALGMLSFTDCEFAPKASGTALTLPAGSGSTIQFLWNTVFLGKAIIGAPNLSVYKSTFNQEVTFTKTGSGTGENLFLGGNLFKKKITIVNQGASTDPIRMGYLQKDIIGQ